MQNEASQIISISKLIPLNETSNETDYSVILNKYDLKYKVIDVYLQIGEIEIQQGWILDISVIAIQAADLFKKIIPYLIAEKLTFRIAARKEIVNYLLDGSLGKEYLGKVISVFPSTTNKAVETAKSLIALTKNHKGPQIPTDMHLGSLVFTRYGGFNPVLKTNSQGKNEKYILNHKNELIKEECSIPFKLQKGINWPFSTIIDPQIIKPRLSIGGSFLLIQKLKDDPKGNVYKGVNFKKWYKPDWCLIKQGNRNMWIDENDRDIIDRLHWQKEVHLQLQDAISIPRFIDFVTDNERGYLIMEFIEGMLLQDKIAELFRNRVWSNLTKEAKLSLLDYLLQIIEIVAILHKKGFVHRDITKANFIISKKGKVFAIDTELAYNYVARIPRPPFQLGTKGYMSPEQIRMEEPSIPQDIYGLGALMLVVFTNLSPTKFMSTNKLVLARNLSFFIRDETIAKFISDCLDVESNNRPEITYLKQCVQENIKITQLSANDPQKIIEHNDIQQGTAIKLIQKALDSLATTLFLTGDGLWFSLANQPDSVGEYSQISIAYYGGLQEGIAGVLYIINKAAINGFDISHLLPYYHKNCSFVRDKFFKTKTLLPPGLYAGTAGIAHVSKQGIDAGLIELDTELINLLQEMLLRENKVLDMKNGIAGQGMSVLAHESLLGKTFSQSQCKLYVETLIKTQLKDGSWPVQMGAKASLEAPRASFAHGVAGILYFLLSYKEKYNLENLQPTLDKGLQWLIKWSRDYIKECNKNPDKFNGDIKTFQTGPAGMSLPLILGYEIIKDPMYKSTAENLLSIYPHYISIPNLSREDGISGLGEIYLEAYRAFGNPEWLQRAQWIANYLVHTTIIREEALCWSSHYSTIPTADLMKGHAGILNFLINYSNRQSQLFPF